MPRRAGRSTSAPISAWRGAPPTCRPRFRGRGGWARSCHPTLHRSTTLDRARLPASPDDAELDAIMARIRAELAARRQALAAGALAMDALPATCAEFEQLPEDAFIEAAFRVALGRSPDARELERANWDMRRRMTRAVFLDRLLREPEAKARGATIPGVALQAFSDRVRRRLRESPLGAALRPATRTARGLKRLANAAPRLARFEEALAATRQAAVSEQTQRFTSFALQQAETLRALEARIDALDGGAPSATLARALAETAAETALPPPEALALLRGAPGPLAAPGASEEQQTALAAAGLTLAEGQAEAGAMLVPAEASLALLDM
ncbi:hypothetical protein, partial [Falsiroseomonas sp. CW058]|uniref:hypothetical protein n=1 Tax=Falsiroseomonas sp. CW058 TaxID=3388664 RepID=UPI003D318A30